MSLDQFSRPRVFPKQAEGDIGQELLNLSRNLPAKQREPFHGGNFVHLQDSTSENTRYRTSSYDGPQYVVCDQNDPGRIADASELLWILVVG